LNFDDSAHRLWKRLTREERQSAARHFFAEPPQELHGTAIGAIVKVRHIRPQVARTLPAEEQAQALATVLDVGEPLASSLLVALHLGDRREMLTSFLEAVGLPHEGGILKDDADGVSVDADGLRAGVQALRARFPPHEVRTYLNTLWLQDPERWEGLRALPEPA
jgi:hypothetical protein